MKNWLGRFARLVVCGGCALALCGGAVAQRGDDSPRMIKVDPPNWWAEMPKAMLLVQGEHLLGARFTLSDSHLRVVHTHVSANGHWAELWLNESPAKAERVSLVAEHLGKSARLSYMFSKRRKSTDGFAGFSSRDAMYLIMTDRFADGDTSNDLQAGDTPNERAQGRGWHGGDLRGVMQHLDYLQQLGITTIWITPVYQNHEGQSYHGYGATDMYAVDEHFGNLDDLKALAIVLHRRGMKLVLDTVPNHVGPAHVWVSDSPEPDWFHGTKAKHREAQFNFEPLANPHSPWRDQKDVIEGWFANVLPDMNQENPSVAQYLTQNAVWWMEQTGADGMRLDTFPFIRREFWHNFHAEIHSLYPHVKTVGEIFNSDATITSEFAGGVTRNGVDTGLDTPFDFPSYFALRDVFIHDAPTTKIADVLRQDALYPHPERLVPFLGNHDTARFLSEPGATVHRLKLAFTVLTTMRGIPEIYSGDEIAMRGGSDPENRRDFPGGFPGDTQSAFSASTRTVEQQDMYAWVQGLLNLRKAHSVLQTGEEQVLQANGNMLAYVRGTNLAQGCSSGPSKERVLVVVNNSDSSVALVLQSADTGIAGCHVGSILWGAHADIYSDGDALRVSVPARQAIVASLQ